ncbi:MAG: hypothetical protein AAB500_01055 [Patescibacteria group bacterium]
MINLIPNQEKKKKVKDFYFRLAVVTFFLLSFTILVASLAMIPAYFLSAAKKDVVFTKLSEESNTPNSALLLETQESIAALTKKLNIVEKVQKNEYRISGKVVNEILGDKISSIKITAILYETPLPKNPGDPNKKVTVQGVATSREELLRFRRALEDNVAFQKVDLPISNFVKGSNIFFSITLTPS